MNEKLYKFLMGLPQDVMLGIMWSALDEMQSYNGRSRTDCIALALGCEETETGRYTLPKRKWVLEQGFESIY